MYSWTRATTGAAVVVVFAGAGVVVVVVEDWTGIGAGEDLTEAGDDAGLFLGVMGMGIGTPAGHGSL